MTRNTAHKKTLLSLSTLGVFIVLGLIGKQAEANPPASACKTCFIAAKAFPIKMSPQIFQLGVDVAKATQEIKEQQLIPDLKALLEQANQSDDTPFVAYNLDPKSFEFTTPFYNKIEGVKYLPGFTYGRANPANPLRNVGYSLLSL